MMHGKKKMQFIFPVNKFPHCHWNEKA